jgi:hypothetical protein
MRRIRTMLLAILCFSGLAVAQKLAYQFDRGIDFSRFKTYQWVTVADNSAPNQITAQNIVNFINTDLAVRVSPRLSLTTPRTLNPSSNGEKNYEKLQKAVAKLLKNFPPNAMK